MKFSYKNTRLHYYIVVFLFFFTGLHAQVKSDSIDKKKVSYAGIPIINYNRTQGMIAGGFGSAFYKVNAKDTISPASQSMIVGIYTQEKSWLVGAMQQFYLKQDTWRIRAAIVAGTINYQYFDGDASTNVGAFEDYSNEAKVAIGQVQRKIWKRLYGGLYAEYNNTKTYFTSQNDSLSVAKLSNIGYVFSQDSRDNVYYPSTGIFMNFRNQFYRDWTGSDYDFVRYKVNYNQFFNLNKDERHILVGRANFEIATGDVPFQAQAVVGSDDIRGYSEGKYRGNQVYTLQSEYRYTFNKSKFGIVGFGGVAWAVEKASEISLNGLLPGVGAGVRYKIIPSMKMNIGIDAGIGKDDYSITFRIGESFGR